MNESAGERTGSDETTATATKRTTATKRAGKKSAATKSTKTMKGRAGTSKKMMAAARESAGKPAGESTQPRTPAAERPVQLPPPKKTSQYVVTIDNATGLPTKIEKLDDETGEKKELSQAEYLQLGSVYTNPYASPATSGFTGYFETPGASEDLSAAYYRGVLDYLKALKLV